VRALRCSAAAAADGATCAAVSALFWGRRWPSGRAVLLLVVRVITDGVHDLALREATRAKIIERLREIT
jgi:hypothetical protein